jgi:hypothetical protein
MKALRVLAAALAVTALAPKAGVAQARSFNDSWFWGLKAGGTLMSAPSKPNLASPMLGGDWLITRTHGGLYVSYDQSFFNQQALIADSITATDKPGLVNLHNMRRLTVAMMGFPGENPKYHPYAGIGITYNQVAGANPVAGYSSADQAFLGQSIITQFKAVFAPVVMVGGQMQARRGSVFAQAMGWPANTQFFLYNKRGFNASLEFGVRFNLSSAIDTDR